MSDPFFFGYGSLVNRRTHSFPEAFPARIRGWRRAWRHSRSHGRTFLTAIPDPGAEIDGLVACVPRGDWAALDQREAGYQRHPVPGPELVHSAARDLAAQIYAIPAESFTDTVHPIRLSYLDVVIQGYLIEFGEAGALEFIDTTDGWNTPIVDDRAAPTYARHQRLTPSERSFVDEQLHRLAATVIRG